MVVQHNLSAMNANRMLGITQGTLSKSTEKLSSGYKVNRAADDAAGLAISEKMRKQIRGLSQASLNAEDGISAVQTAEGALTEVHDMLQRMNELANKASNGTNSEADRQTIQDEISQLTTEIDRVAETTKFNETYLLKGNAAGTSSDKLVNAHDAGLAGKLVDNGKTATFTLDSELKEGEKVVIGGTEYTIGTDAAGKSGTDGYKKLAADATTTVKAGDSLTDVSTNKTYTIVDKLAEGDLASSGLTLTTGKSAFTITHADGSTVTYDVNNTAGTGKISEADAADLIKQELAAGSKITMTKDMLGEACNVEIVDSLETTEISSYDLNLVKNDGTKQSTVDNFVKAVGMADTNGSTTVDAADLSEGDSITIGGETTTFLKSDPVTASDIAGIVEKLDDGAKVAVARDNGSGDKTSVTYTVGKKTDVVNNTYTVADLANLIQDGDDVAIATTAKDYDAINDAAAKDITIAQNADSATPTLTNTYTVVGNVQSEEKDVISKAEALQKMAEELEKASSIGTDTAASVKNNNDGTFDIVKGSVEVKDRLNFALHVGADADMTNKITVSVDSMSAAGLGIKGINVADDNGSAGTYAIDAISDAIETVSKQRSLLGAVQNRLEHTINNLDNVVENTTAAESQIRDTDMATEMVKYSNANILSQAGQSMLAQANQSNQGVLSLLG